MVKAIDHSESVSQGLFNSSITVSLEKILLVYKSSHVFRPFNKPPQVTHYNNIKKHAARVVGKNGSLLI